MTVLWSCGPLFDPGWRGPDEAINAWLRRIGGEPNETCGVEVVADGDGMVRAVIVATDEWGRPLVEGNETVKRDRWLPLTELPPGMTLTR